MPYLEVSRKHSYLQSTFSPWRYRLMSTRGRVLFNGETSALRVIIKRRAKKLAEANGWAIRVEGADL